MTPKQTARMEELCPWGKYHGARYPWFEGYTAALESPEVKGLVEGYEKLLKFTDLQAKDESLWFKAEYVSEAIIQRGLRGCHMMVESVAKNALKLFKGDGGG